MSTLTKTFVVLNLVFALAFVVVSATVLSQRANWKQQCSIVQGKLEQEKLDHRTTRDDLEKKLKRQENKANESDQKVTLLTQDLDDIKQKLEQSKLDIQEQKKLVASQQSQMDALVQGNKNLTDKLINMQTMLDTVKKDLGEKKGTLTQRDAEIVKLNGQINGLELTQNQLNNVVDDQKGEIDDLARYKRAVRAFAPSVHVRAQDYVQGGSGKGPVPDVPIAAFVKNVDMSIKTVVLNVGTDTKPVVKEGYEFLIHRGGKFIAAVRVTRVDKEMCAAEIIPPEPQDAVKVGDRAMTHF